MSHLIIFLPTFLLVIPFGLMFIKKLSNAWIHFITALILIITTVLMGREIALDTINGGLAAGIFFGILVFVLNALPYNLAFRFYELHRCPKCHSLRVKKCGKEVEEFTKTITEEYSYGSNPGIFRQKFETIVRYTDHKLYCPDCNHIYHYEEMKREHLKGPQKRIR